MRRIGDIKGPGAALVLALALAGCSSTSDLFSKETNWLPSPVSSLQFSDFRVFRGAKNDNVTRPVAPEDLIDPSGYCSGNAPDAAAVAAVTPAVAPAPPPPAPAPTMPPQADGPMVLTPSAVSMTPPPPNPAPPAVSNEPPIAAAPAPAADAPVVPREPGGVALKMTECQVVRRVGHPEKFEFAPDAHGERNVTLTYIHGERPGIYQFVAGRLKEIVRAPEPPPPPPKLKKKKRAKRSV
jgi:hypothetical protein